jgi:hypothetical protein
LVVIRRLSPLLRTPFGRPAGTEERVLPFPVVLNRSLLKKVMVAVLIAAAETVVAMNAMGKGKPK